MKELKKVTAMLGTMLTKEEIEDFMREADVVRYKIIKYSEFRLVQNKHPEEGILQKWS